MPKFFVPACRWQLPQPRLLPANRFARSGTSGPIWGVSRGDKVAPTPHQAPVVVIRQRADFRNGPDLLRWRRLLRGARPDGPAIDSSRRPREREHAYRQPGSRHPITYRFVLPDSGTGILYHRVIGS